MSLRQITRSGCVLTTVCLGATVWSAFPTTSISQPAGTVRTVALSCDEMERFLKTAPIRSLQDLSVGVTVPRRAVLDDGRIKHEAAIQIVEERKPVFQGQRGTELNFRDSWQFNIAGYELAKLLGLNMVPPYVERRVDGQGASASWWIGGAMMERDRYTKKIPPPDAKSWNHEMYAVRVFHQLIHDSDPNLTNLLITKDWRIWMIDFTRAFRSVSGLQNPKALANIDRRLLTRLRELSADTLLPPLKRWLDEGQIAALLARRELLIKHFENEIARSGEAAVLYDLPRTNEPCGAGLN